MIYKIDMIFNILMIANVKKYITPEMKLIILQKSQFYDLFNIFPTF